MRHHALRPYIHGPGFTALIPPPSSRSPLESRLLITDRVRGPTRLDEVAEGRLPDPALSEIAALARLAEADPLWLIGGEPTLRPDLLSLIAATAEARGASVGLVTDALALAHAGRLGALISRGLGRLRVTLHSARPDAHDWLVTRPGAWRTALRALKLAREAGLPTELVATVTRATGPHLSELIALAGRLGVSKVHLRALRLRPGLANRAVELAPRWALTEPALVRARAFGADHDIEVRLHGFPRCAAGRAGHACVSARTIQHLAVAAPAWDARLMALAPAPGALACPTCPGGERCDGAPSAYIDRFGWSELLSAELPSEDYRGHLSCPRTEADTLVGGLPTPAPRAGRVPYTRASQLRHAPPARPAPPPPATIWLDLADHRGALLSRRDARRRLTEAAQQGATTLRLVGPGALDHPDAAALLRDATRLDFARVEAAGDAGRLADTSVRDLYFLRRLGRVDIALFGPDASLHDARVGRPGAFEAALSIAQRLARVARIEVGAYAVIDRPDELDLWDGAWRRGHLPGSPAFRLAPSGGQLEALAAAARRSPEGATRDALARLLPPCLIAPDEAALTAPPPAGARFHRALDPEAPPSPLDPRGAFEACVRCARSYARPCPGVALGWSLTSAGGDE